MGVFYIVILRLTPIKVRFAEVDEDIDPLGLGGTDSLDLGPQLGGAVCDFVPAPPDETQVHNPSIEDLRARGGVCLEDIHQNAGGESVDRGDVRTSGGGLRHVSKVVATISRRPLLRHANERIHWFRLERWFIEVKCKSFKGGAR